jgi:hypothetical protein
MAADEKATGFPPSFSAGNAAAAKILATAA